MMRIHFNDWCLRKHTPPAASLSYNSSTCAPLSAKLESNIYCFLSMYLSLLLDAHPTFGFQWMMGFVSEVVLRGFDRSSNTEHTRATRVHQNSTQVMVLIMLLSQSGAPSSSMKLDGMYIQNKAALNTKTMLTFQTFMPSR